MKKISILGLAALAAMTLSTISCSKDETTLPFQQEQPVRVLNAKEVKGNVTVIKGSYTYTKGNVRVSCEYTIIIDGNVTYVRIKMTVSTGKILYFNGSVQGGDIDGIVVDEDGIVQDFDMELMSDIVKDILDSIN